MAKDKALVGAAGVHYVAFKLSFLEIATGLTAPGVKDVDLLATNTETGKSITIQVKTMTKAYMNPKKREPFWKWHVGNKMAEAAPKAGLFLAFVDLSGAPSAVPGASLPNVFIVPSADLKPFLDLFPATSKSPKSYWCDIYDTQASNSKNCWNLIEVALA